MDHTGCQRGQGSQTVFLEEMVLNLSWTFSGGGWREKKQSRRNLHGRCCPGSHLAEAEVAAGRVGGRLRVASNVVLGI